MQIEVKMKVLFFSFFFFFYFHFLQFYFFQFFFFHYLMNSFLFFSFQNSNNRKRKKLSCITDYLFHIRHFLLDQPANDLDTEEKEKEREKEREEGKEMKWEGALWARVFHLTGYHRRITFSSLETSHLQVFYFFLFLFYFILILF